jgi:hypothetical protein
MQKASPYIESVMSHGITMERKLEPIWLWIKNNHHPILVFGAIFVVLGLLSGIFWAFGADIEPIAFTFCLLSSLLFASPSVAEYFLPNRKHVKDMNFDELLAFIPTTDPLNDWCGITKDWSSERFLKEDPRLRFRSKTTDDGIQCEDFQEPWANCYRSPKATGYWYDLFYDGSFIDRIVIVSVDGTRANIPCPNIRTGLIDKYNYVVAKMFDVLENLDEYLLSSGLEVDDS